MSAADNLHRHSAPDDLPRRNSAQAVVEATITRRKTAQAAAIASDERVLKALSDAWEAAQQPLSEDAQRGLTSTAATIIGGSYVTIGGLALGGGIVMGMRSFEDTAAFEVLEKMERPTAAAEAHAMKLTSRAFGLASLLTVGSAVSAVLVTRYVFNVRSAADFGRAMKVALSPANNWLHATSEQANAVGKGFNSWAVGVSRQWWPRGDPAAENAR